MPPTFWTIAVSSLLLMVRSAVLINTDENTQLCSSRRGHSKDLTNSNLTRVPSDLPDDTEYLDLSENNISRIVYDDLYRLTRLCFLKIAHCGLQFISHDAFYNNTKLKVLNVSYNQLTVIPYLSQPQLTILDLSGNDFESYNLPDYFSNLTQLNTFAIGSPNLTSLVIDDFASLRNIHLKQFTFGGGTEMQKYENGSFAQLSSLEEVSLRVPFCNNFDIFKAILMDLDQTHTRRIRFIKLFPDQCTITSDPFEILEKLHVLCNLTIVNTLINSTVMVKLFQNILKSTFEKLEFVNITYSEDTPDGFQLPRQNHTLSLRAFIFNGVNHYQYKYPIVNMSMDVVAQLTYMRISHTGMNILPCNFISVIPSLQTLDLSNNLLDDTGLWWPLCSHEHVYPSLRWLLLSNNRFSDLAYISKMTKEMKLLISLDLSFNSIQVGDSCSWPSHITELNLSHNNLGNSVFDCLSPHFQKIDLSKTGISVIPQDLHSKFPRLTHLILSFNSIQLLPSDLRAPVLQTLFVDQNVITSIDQAAIEGLSGLQTLKASNNPFVCDCDSFSFVTLLNKSLLPDWPLDYTCSSPPSFAGKNLDSYKPGKLSCLPGLQAAVAVSLIVALTAALGIGFYACDGLWYTKMLWVWIRVKRRKAKQEGNLMNNTCRYHAFISYSQHDCTWVNAELLPTMEGAGLSICIHERDFVPGQWIVDNIISSVESSYKTIFILSKHFVQSEWCNYELFFAQHRAIGVNDDSLVFILLEPIPTESLPKKFLRLRTLLMQKTYLEWPRDETKKKVFWASLRSMLQTSDKSMLLKDIADDIAENALLLNAEN